MILAVVAFAIVTLTTIAIVISNRRKKVRRLSENLGVSNVKETNIEDIAETTQPGVEVEEINLNTAVDVQEILRQKAEAEAKKNIKPTGEPPKPMASPKASVKSVDGKPLGAPPIPGGTPKAPPRSGSPAKPEQPKPSVPKKPNE